MDKKQHDSTRIRHEQMYKRYKELLASTKEKIGRDVKSIYMGHYYDLLNEEFGYGVKYISDIINQQKRREASLQAQKSERTADLGAILS